MTKIGYILLAVLGAVAFACGWSAGRGIPYSDQVQLLRELREVSTIIFGIMGAWAAIVYPEELKRRLRATETNALDAETLGRFRKLMLCIILSAAMVAVVLVMQFTAPAMARVAWVQQHSHYFRSASFAVACLLAVAQVWVILLMLVPINAADGDVRAAQQTQESLSGGPQGKKGRLKR